MLHNWPGNVRELKNIIERLVIMTPSDVIDAGDIPVFSHCEVDRDAGGSGDAADSLKTAKMDFERQFIMKKLKEFEGNISKNG